MPFFLQSLPKYEQKKIFSKNLSSYYNLGNIWYFQLVSKFLTFIKGSERFLIFGWMVGEKLLREKLDNKQVSSLPNPWLTREKLMGLV